MKHRTKSKRKTNKKSAYAVKRNALNARIVQSPTFAADLLKAKAALNAAKLALIAATEAVERVIAPEAAAPVTLTNQKADYQLGR